MTDRRTDRRIEIAKACKALGFQVALDGSQPSAYLGDLEEIILFLLSREVDRQRSADEGAKP